MPSRGCVEARGKAARLASEGKRSMAPVTCGMFVPGCMCCGQRMNKGEISPALIVSQEDHHIGAFCCQADVQGEGGENDGEKEGEMVCHRVGLAALP